MNLKFIRERLRNSIDGVNAANAEFQKLKNEFITQWQSDVSLSVDVTINSKHAENNLQIICLNYCSLGVTWMHSYLNTLEKSKLKIEFWKGGIRQGRYGDPVVDESFEFDFFLSDSEQYVWQSDSKNNREFTSQNLAQFILKKYLDEIERTLHPSKYMPGLTF